MKSEIMNICENAEKHLIKEKDNLRAKLKEKTLIETYGEIQSFYLMSDGKVAKFGQGKLKDRIGVHKRELGHEFYLIYAIFTPYYRELETLVKKHYKSLGRLVPPREFPNRKDKCTELIQLDKKFTIKHLYEEIQILSEQVKEIVINKQRDEITSLKAELSSQREQTIEIQSTQTNQLTKDIKDIKELIQEKNGKEFQCSLCFYQSDKKENVKRHIKLICPDGQIIEIPIEIICTYCKKLFSTNVCLTRHLKICKIKKEQTEKELRDQIQELKVAESKTINNTNNTINNTKNKCTELIKLDKNFTFKHLHEEVLKLIEQIPEIVINKQREEINALKDEISSQREQTIEVQTTQTNQLTKDIKEIKELIQEKNGKEFQCSICHYRSDRKQNVERHINRTTKCSTSEELPEVIEISVEIKCINCNKIFTSERSLKRHLENSCKILKQIKKDEQIQ